MARPNESANASLHIYFRPDQKEYLKQLCHSKSKELGKQYSPSKFLRELLDNYKSWQS